MKILLIDSGGIISSHDTIEEAEIDFKELCNEAFNFNDNICIVEVLEYLK